MFSDVSAITLNNETSEVSVITNSLVLLRIPYIAMKVWQYRFAIVGCLV